MPFKDLIKNKLHQAQINENSLYPYPIFGFFGGVTKEELYKYLTNCEVPKILVTYDSLGRLADLIDPSIFNILVDEYHCLFIDYSFREAACTSVLKNYKRFNCFTFMTATPIEDQFLLKELRGIKTVVAKWKDARQVQVIPVKSGKSVLKTTIAHAKKFIYGEIEGNAYIFVNSVKFLVQVIKSLGLTPGDVRIICSENSQDKLPAGFLRGKTTDEPKKINIITKAGFEGCDIYDTEGKTIIVSDPYIEHSLVDIQIQIPQIIGRIRNSRYNRRVEHIYSHTRGYDTSKLSYDELSDILDEGMREGEILIEECNTNRLRVVLRDLVDKRSTTPGVEYIKFDEEGNPQVDENRYLIALYLYRLVNTTYATRNGMNNAYQKGNLKIVDWNVDYSDFEVVPAGNFANFKEAYHFVKEVRDKKFNGAQLSLMEMQGEKECYETYPYLKAAISKLGYDRIEREAKYVQTNIKRMLAILGVSDGPVENYYKIYQLLILERCFSIGEFISDKVAKDMLTKAFKDVGFSGKGITASMLDKFFITKSCLKGPTKDRVRGRTIVDHKYQLRKCA